ncbi:hypothetical protein ACTPOE_08435 [Castellaniella sp. WN]
MDSTFQGPPFATSTARAYVLDRGQITHAGSATEFGQDEQRGQELAGASAQK